MNSLTNQILNTLFYHARYSYPLTLSELHRYLITSVPVSRSRVERELQKLVKVRKVRKSGLYFSLRDFPDYPYHSDAPDFTFLRLRRQSHSAPKLLIARRAARLLSFIPTVKLICVTGSLAMENCDQSDDIDLMIVTSANSLWLTRPFVVLLISLFFRRRLPNFPKPPKFPKFPNEICLNLWFDTTVLMMSLSRQNLRTAHELAQMKPILNKNQTYEKMLFANQWLKTHLANISLPSIPLSSLSSLSPLSSLNWLFYWLQLLYMSPRRTTEKVGLHSAWFHPKGSQLH